MTSRLRNSFLGCNAVLTGCALTNNSYMETVTYVYILNKIYNILIFNDHLVLYLLILDAM